MVSRDANSYLTETEHAVRLLFAGIEYYEGLLHGLTPPSQAGSGDEVALYMEAAEKYFGYSFSEATLCGSILQVAYMGVLLFSANANISDHCRTLVGPIASDHKVIHFCVGRLIHGIPIGLLIYAGRNQFNHWADKTFDYPTTQVFRALGKAYHESPFFDLAYELSYPNRTIKANHLVLNELRWKAYEDYLGDMTALIGPR